MSKSFVHLHTHSDYSLLDGAAKIDELFKAAAKNQMPALAITDHGNMYGTIDAWEASQRHGVKYIPAYEAYVAPNDRFKKEKLDGYEPYYHLTILATSNIGLKNLYKIVTKSYTEGYYYKPRCDMDLLSQHSEGLIALSGCLAGLVGSSLMVDDFSSAEKAVSEYVDIFGKDSFFIELQDHNLPEQKKVLPGLFELAKRFSIPTVGTGDIHYVYKEQYANHDFLLCVQTGASIDQENRFRFGSDQFYMKTAEEMRSLFPSDSCDSTLQIAERCNVSFDTNTLHIPQADVPEGYDEFSWLKHLVYGNAGKRYSSITKEIEDRIEYELETIKKIGFAGYFLVVKDIVDFCHREGILLGVGGRGSVTASIVSYILRISGLDPLKYDLDFSRFLTDGRRSPPDIDLDVDDRQRHRVLEYIKQRHGSDRVGQIITFHVIRGKSAIRDSARVLNLPFALGDRLSKIYPEPVLGREFPLNEALKTSAELRKLYDTHEDVRSIIDKAKAIEGFIRQDSIHAGGIVVGDAPLVEYLPLQQKGEDKPIVAQFDMETVEKLGLLKIDILGLRNLSVVDRCVKLAKKDGVDIDLESIPEDDRATFALLQRGMTTGVFQLETSPGIKDLCRKLRPSSIKDIMALVALYRPGPMGENLHLAYARRKHGKENVDYLHEDLTPILKDTYGLLIYQEQIVRIAQRIAGYTPQEADDFRKAVGKKIPEKMQEQQTKFISGMVKKGYEKESAVKLFNTISYFAGYGFSAAHAAAYGYLGYMTAYLKVHYPVYYMAALLSSSKRDKDRTVAYLHECRRVGLRVLPPDVNESVGDFSCKGNSILFGLGSISGLGASAVKDLIAERQKGRFKDYLDFCLRMSPYINQKIVGCLARVGAFDNLFTESERHQQIAMDVLPNRSLIRRNEKELLGSYVSDHPMSELEPSKIQIEDLSSMPFGERVTITGSVTITKEKTSKKGDKMAQGMIEDLTGSIDVLFFPGIWEKLSKMLDIEVFSFYGRVEHRDGMVDYTIQDVSPIETEKPITLSLDVDDIDSSYVESLVKLTKDKDGDLPLEIELHDRLGRSIVIDLGVRVSTNFMKKLKEDMG